MSLTPAICTQCGADIEVESSHEAGICKHCGTAFITEKVINNYVIKNEVNNTYNTSVVNSTSINANVVNMFQDELNKFFVIEGTELTKYNGNATNVVVPDFIQHIGIEVFKDCKLKSVKLPAGLLTIGDSAFYCCPNLTSIEIPQGVTSIGDSAFWWCSSITNIKLPDSLEIIGDGAFSCCDGLISINLPDGLKSIGESAFSGCSSITSINLPDSIISIGQNAFFECVNLEHVQMSSEVECIASDDYGVSYNKNIFKATKYKGRDVCIKEKKQPRKNIIKAILGGICIIIGVVFLISLF